MRVFLDFEASSLNKDSYPVEVGWVLEHGSGEAHLIRPAPDWTDWDPEAEILHGITRTELLRDGEAPQAICSRLIELFENNLVYCSAPSWDGHWLSMLLRAAGQKRHLLRMRDSEEAFVEAARDALGDGADDTELEALVSRVRESAGLQPVAHRALADARQEWEIWRTLRAG